MAVGLATPLFIGACAVLQLALGLRLLRRHGAVGLVAALLLLFNGLGAAVLAVRSATTTRVADLALDLFDVPTGMLLLGFGALAFRPAALEASVRGRAGTLAVLLGLVAAGMAATAGVYATVGPATARWVAFYAIYAASPVYLGYALVVLAATRQVLRPGAARTEAWALLLAGFGARAAEFAVLYGSMAGIELASGTAPPDVPDLLNRVSSLVMALTVAGCTAALLVAAASRRRGLAIPLVALAAGAALGWAEKAAAVDMSSFPGYFLTVVTLYLVRPVFVGLAFDAQAAGRSLLQSGLAAGAFALMKLALSPVLGADPMTWGALDVGFLGLALLLTATAFRWWPTGWTWQEPPPGLSPAPAVEVRKPATRAEALGTYLLAVARASDGRAWTTKPDLRKGTGVEENNVAAELRRMSAAVRRSGWDGLSPLVEEMQEGLRGRKRYRLSGSGVAAVARWLEPGKPGTAGAGNEAPPGQTGDPTSPDAPASP